MCVHGVLGFESIKTMKFEILIERLKFTVVWYVTPFHGTSYYPEHGGSR
jgi:hypothetical protein